MLCRLTSAKGAGLCVFERVYSKKVSHCAVAQSDPRCKTLVRVVPASLTHIRADITYCYTPALAARIVQADSVYVVVLAYASVQSPVLLDCALQHLCVSAFTQGKPAFQHGTTDDRPVLPVAPEVFVLRKLLPASDEFDFNIHVMDFEPGQYLYVKEIHYNQHGLLLLQGQGIYRLGNNWCVCDCRRAAAVETQCARAGHVFAFCA